FDHPSPGVDSPQTPSEAARRHREDTTVPMSSAPAPPERPGPGPASTSRPRAPSPAPSPSHPDPAMPAPAPRLSDGPGRLGAEGMRPASARLSLSRYGAVSPARGI